MGGAAQRRRARRGAGAVGCLAGLLLAAAPAGAASNTEPLASSQWGLRQIGAERAWDVTRGRGARVGIIDTGVDLGHRELSGRVVASTRCIGTGGLAARCGGSAQDDGGHGTHVAGILAAPLDRSGVAGVAPEASLLIVKALDAEGAGDAADVVAGIDWLLSQGVHVVNLSLAEASSLRPASGAALEAAIQRASRSGAVVVVAAGNDPDETKANVASDLPAIVVGATDRRGRLAPYSRPLDGRVRWGLVAPGGQGVGEVEDDVISTYWFAGRRSSYAWSAGTSMATPHVSGVAALLAARGVRGQAAVDQMLGTAGSTSCGAGCRGLVNASAALCVGPVTPQPTTRAAAAPQPPAATAAPAVPAARPATAVAPSPGPPVVAPGAAVGPTTGEVAGAPLDELVALTAPEVPVRGAVPVWSLLAAGAALLSVTAATAVVAWRRIRSSARW